MLVDPILSSIRSSPESLPRTHVLKAFLSTKLCVLNNNYYFDAITSVAMLSWPNSSKHLVFRGSYVAFLQGFVFFFFLSIYLFLAVLGFRGSAWAFSSCDEQGLPFVVVCRLLVVVAFSVAEHGF